MRFIRKLIAIWVCKALIYLGKLLGKKGSSTPGSIALKIYPNILKELAGSVKKDIIAVCGTNGKTTTNNLIFSILKKSGKQVVCNNVGANMLPGIANAFIDSTDIWGNITADYACLEIDEASCVRVFDHLKPDWLLITNLFRDQLDRYGEIDITIKLLQKALKKTPDTTLILNGDDPLTAQFGFNTARSCVYYGIDEDAGIGISETKEGRFCTICGTELSYKYYHYSQLGNFYCGNCGFSRPTLDFRAYSLSLENGIEFLVDYSGGTQPIKADYRGFYNIYNMLAAFSAASLFSIPTENVNDVFAQYKPQIGRMESFYLGKPVIFNLSKNPAGFNQAISTALQDKRQKDIMIVINDNAQDGIDISWIWDVDFERLHSDNIKSFVISGTRKEDVAVRLKYAGIANAPITAEGDIKKAICSILEQNGEVCYILVNYTALFTTHDILKALEGEAK